MGSLEYLVLTPLALGCAEKKPCEIKWKVRRTIPKWLLTPSPLPRFLSAQFHSCPGLAADVCSTSWFIPMEPSRPCLLLSDPPHQPRSTFLEHSKLMERHSTAQMELNQFAGWHT